MINLNYTFKKNKLNVNEKTNDVLININSLKENNKFSERKTLNVAFSIDCSGSMNSTLNNQYGLAHNLGNIENYTKTKIEMVKEATINAISQMKNGDHVSISTFSNDITSVLESTEITDNNRNLIIAKIRKIQTFGMTNLHGGLMKAYSDILDKFDEKFLNRVIILTDGQTNIGITEPDLIASDVSKFQNNGISTTTIGVGSDYNEVLMESLSTIGKGNYYYIEKNEDFEEMFYNEFSGISNLYGTDVEIEFNLNKGFSVKESLNKLTNINDKSFKLNDLISSKEENLIFSLKTKKLVVGLNKIGSFIVSYKDDKGNLQEVEEDIIIECVEEADYKEIKENKNFVEHREIIEISRDKDLAISMLRVGDVEKSRAILRNSYSRVSASLGSLESDLINSEMDDVESLIKDYETTDKENILKKMSFQSYSSRNSKF